MKKVPSYPKISVKIPKQSQPLTLNINSPKIVNSKKGFVSDNKKTKTLSCAFRNNIEDNLHKEQPKILQIAHKEPKVGSKANKQVTYYENSIKNSKSQKQLLMLSEKLKKLEQKIKIIKRKEHAQKNSISQRSLSKNRENSSYAKGEAISSRKAIELPKKYIIGRAESQKVLKRSHLDKAELGITREKKLKKSEVSKYSIEDREDRDKKQKQVYQSKYKQAQQHSIQVIHQFVTQVPNSHPHTLKQSVQKSIGLPQYALTPSNQSQKQSIEEPLLYYIGKAAKSLMKPALYSVREHLIQSLQTMQYLQNIKKPNIKELQKKQVHLPQPKHRYSIVLDLDETLIHCNQTLSIPHDIKLSIKFPTGQKIDAGVNIRPFAKQFLSELASICQVIVFTASHECYANVVLDHLDPKKQYISHRLFREHCWQTEQGIYIKDLRVLKNRSLDNMILVDNAAYSYFFQLQNGVPIVPYYDDNEDSQLVTLLSYIKQGIERADSSGSTLKKLNGKYFKLMQYRKFEDVGPLVEELYSTTDSFSHGT